MKYAFIFFTLFFMLRDFSLPAQEISDFFEGDALEEPVSPGEDAKSPKALPLIENAPRPIEEIVIVVEDSGKGGPLKKNAEERTQENPEISLESAEKLTTDTFVLSSDIQKETPPGPQMQTVIIYTGKPIKGSRLSPLPLSNPKVLQEIKKISLELGLKKKKDLEELLLSNTLEK